MEPWQSLTSEFSPPVSNPIPQLQAKLNLMALSKQADDCLAQAGAVPTDACAEDDQLHALTPPAPVVARPGIGTLGRSIPLRANFFEIHVDPKLLPVHQYHAEIHHPGMRTIDR